MLVSTSHFIAWVEVKLLCEQNASFGLSLSDRAYILEKGQICWSGEVSDLREKPEILKTHLGI